MSWGHNRRIMLVYLELHTIYIFIETEWELETFYVLDATNIEQSRPFIVVWLTIFVCSTLLSCAWNACALSQHTSSSEVGVDGAECKQNEWMRLVQHGLISKNKFSNSSLIYCTCSWRCWKLGRVISATLGPVSYQKASNKYIDLSKWYFLFAFPYTYYEVIPNHW